MPRASAETNRVAAIRKFNRFYTRQIGMLRKGYLDSPFSLAEARVLYELYRCRSATASELATILDLDQGYLSRLLRVFEKRGLIKRTISVADARQSDIALTAKGRRTFAPLDKRSQHDAGAMLDSLSSSAQARLVGAMTTIESLLSSGAQAGMKAAQAGPAYILRAPKPGDLGWVVTRHAQLYLEEYGWGEPFEGLCAQIVADFQNKFDPKWERCWIAELNGENVGCVMVVKDRPGVARLRLLLVDPKGRGLGVGAALVDKCIAFARKAGYRTMTLWTHSVLTGARHIYEKTGFTLTSSERRHTWGQDVVAEFWDLKL